MQRTQSGAHLVILGSICVAIFIAQILVFHFVFDIDMFEMIMAFATGEKEMIQAIGGGMILVVVSILSASSVPLLLVLIVCLLLMSDKK